MVLKIIFELIDLSILNISLLHWHYCLKCEVSWKNLVFLFTFFIIIAESLLIPCLSPSPESIRWNYLSCMTECPAILYRTQLYLSQLTWSNKNRQIDSFYSLSSGSCLKKVKECMNILLSPKGLHWFML